jgi:hypothetical protein
MPRKKVAGILMISAFVIFALFAPIVPLMHSWPANAPSLPSPMAFHGSLSRASILQIGLEIDGIGVAHFRV